LLKGLLDRAAARAGRILFVVADVQAPATGEQDCRDHHAQAELSHRHPTQAQQMWYRRKPRPDSPPKRAKEINRSDR
jgi:hypothetical protein